MAKKYIIVKKDFIQEKNKLLYRIKATKNFKNVKRGDLGGYIESKSNLSQTDNSWIYDNAMVYGNAKIYENAEIHDKIKVYDNAKIYGDISLSGDIEINGNTELFED